MERLDDTERSLYLFALTSRLATGERIYRFEIREGYCDEMDNCESTSLLFRSSKIGQRNNRAVGNFFLLATHLSRFTPWRERERGREGCLPRPVGGKQSERSQLTFSWLLGKYTPRAVVRVHPCDRCMATCHVRVSCDTTASQSLASKGTSPSPILSTGRDTGAARRETAKPT